MLMKYLPRYISLDLPPRRVARRLTAFYRVAAAGQTMSAARARGWSQDFAKTLARGSEHWARLKVFASRASAEYFL
jgi:hypothetical protein